MYEINPEAIIINDELSVLDGATHWWGKLRGKKITGNWWVGELYAIAEHMNVDLNLPWKDLHKDFKKAILYGTDDKIYSFTYNSRDYKIRNCSCRSPSKSALFVPRTLRVF
ncbi:hypothetical protein QBE52_12825 [Clostridiaceae bacterium 35-E11]